MNSQNRSAAGSQGPGSQTAVLRLDGLVRRATAPGVGAHSCPRGEVSCRHLIGGEAFGVSFEPGDPVHPDVPAEKLEEWLAAELIEILPIEPGEDL